jgi:hypothetical protein
MHPWPVVASAIAASARQSWTHGGVGGSTADDGVSGSTWPSEAASSGFRRPFACLWGQTSESRTAFASSGPSGLRNADRTPRLARCRGGVILDTEQRFSRFASQPLWPTWLVGERPPHAQHTARPRSAARRANSVPSRTRSENHGR